MADVFENRADLIPHRLRLLELIARTPQLDWLLLTKRNHLVKKQLPKGYEFPSNVWLGTTVENQAEADKRVRHLLCGINTRATPWITSHFEAGHFYELQCGSSPDGKSAQLTLVDKGVDHKLNLD